MKNLVYDTPVNSDIDLGIRKSIAAIAIHETPGIFEHEICGINLIAISFGWENFGLDDTRATLD